MSLPTALVAAARVVVGVVIADGHEAAGCCHRQALDRRRKRKVRTVRTGERLEHRRPAVAYAATASDNATGASSIVRRVVPSATRVASLDNWGTGGGHGSWASCAARDGSELPQQLCRRSGRRAFVATGFGTARMGRSSASNVRHGGSPVCSIRSRIKSWRPLGLPRSKAWSHPSEGT